LKDGGTSGQGTLGACRGSSVIVVIIVIIIIIIYIVNVTNTLKITQTKKKNSMVCVRERTIPTERPPLVGEVIANFCG
jgi:hypothetical protein